jgi:Tfp pilus assembly protein PilF
MNATTSLRLPVPAHRVRRLLDQAQGLVTRHQLLEAAKVYAEVLVCDPDCVEALGHLGSLFFEFGQHEAALASLQRAIHFAPRKPKLHLLLGAVHKALGRMEESAACCQQEVRLCPSDPDARYDLGLMLQSLKRPDEAVRSFKHAVRLRPDYVDAWVAMGMALRQTGAHEDALKSFDRAIQLDPNQADSHFEAGNILLSLGRFERGWKEYEWRWKVKDSTRATPWFKQPLWDGKDLGGRRILLHCEQGFGDTIQFCRYASLVADLHGEVILGCPSELLPIMENARGVREVVTSRLKPPNFDIHAPLMSLPWILGTRLETIPCEIPYLHAPHKAPSSPPWVEPSDALKVGVAWSGSAGNINGRYRSLQLKMLRPLLSVPDVEWYSLQCGEAANELLVPEFAGQIENLGVRLKDFGDTAQAMDELDLIISVDTSVAHLAGALGRPVWTLLSSKPDWRWMTQREDSPWYPTMRLFRQAKLDDWEGVVTRVKAALTRLCQHATPAVPASSSSATGDAELLQFGAFQSINRI